MHSERDALRPQVRELLGTPLFGFPLALVATSENKPSVPFHTMLRISACIYLTGIAT